MALTPWSAMRATNQTFTPSRENASMRRFGNWGRMEFGKLSRPWLTLGVRLSVFPASPWEAPDDLWEQVVGASPEAVQSQPKQHLQTQGGPWEGGALQVTVTPALVVWAGAVLATDNGLPAVENWRVEDVLPKFKEITRVWLTSVDFGITRIGFGLHTLLLAPDRSAAYELLNDLVQSVEIDPEHTSDFSYQINRPVPSRVLSNDARMNRLMKWSAPMFRVGAMQVTTAGLVQVGPTIGDVYVGLENDTNTPADRVEPLDKALLGAIYDELVELAWKNLEFGETA